ncbi:MAG: MarR family transcriptional regulator [Raoultibacter sp.]
MAASSAEAMRELFEIMQRFRQDRLQALALPEGVTPAEARVALMIYRQQQAEEPLRPSCIAQHMHATPSSLSQTLKTMEEKGLIERQRSTQDSRSVSLVLTEKGTATACEVQQLFQAHMDAVAQEIGQEDIEHLTRTLKRIIAFHEKRNSEE